MGLPVASQKVLEAKGSEVFWVVVGACLYQEATLDYRPLGEAELSAPSLVLLLLPGPVLANPFGHLTALSWQPNTDPWAVSPEGGEEPAPGSCSGAMSTT